MDRMRPLVLPRDIGMGLVVLCVESAHHGDEVY